MPEAPGSNSKSMKDINVRVKKMSNKNRDLMHVYSDIGGHGGDHCSVSPEEMKRDGSCIRRAKE